MDLVLINPAGRGKIYQGLSTTYSAIETPVWAGLMATFVSLKGFSAHIIDANAEGLAPDALAQRVKEINPLLVAVVAYGQQPSASTQVMPGVREAIEAIKNLTPDQKVVLAGGHVSALPEVTLHEETAADYVAKGEGLHTLIGLLEMLEAGVDEPHRVCGLWYRQDGMMLQTESGPLVTDLNNEMPGIYWRLLNIPKYRAHNWHTFGDLNRQPYAAIYTTLGCPYRCTFCCIQAPFKDGEKALGMKPSVNSYRFWSTDAVLAQLDTLAANNVKHIKIADEMFVLNPAHVTAICDKIIERKYQFNFWAYARVDTVKDKLLEKLKKAGVNWLAFGIEAASEKVRDDVQKGYGQDDIFATIKKVRESDINVIANYIFGLPEDDLATMQETLDMAIELNCEFANFYCTMAYPGSALYQLAIQKGWKLPDNWSGYSQHSVDMRPLPTNYLTSDEVVRFRDAAFTQYFSNPKYLAMVEKRFGVETLKHVQEMTSHKLVRQGAK